MRPALPTLLAALWLTSCGGADPAERVARQAPSPVATPPAVPVDDPAEPRLHGRYVTAEVLSRTHLRKTRAGRRIQLVGQETEFGSRTVFSVLERRDGWVRVQTPAVRNGRWAWIPEHRVRLGSTNFSIHVDRSARRLQVRVKDRVVHRMTVAIGRPGNETPTGRFAVTDKLRFTGPPGPYGCCAVALTGHQHKLEPGWVGGDRLAIHGTPLEVSVGKAVSLGCLRARRKDLEVLMRRLPLGTPVYIRP